MKKTFVTLLTLIALTSLSACSSQEKKAAPKPEETKINTQIVKKDTTPAHQDIRLKFNDITLATAANQFKGGTNLATLKTMFGEPVSHEDVPAGDVTVDLYTWTFDQVTVRVHLYNDSSIVRSINNFQFNREQTVSKSDVDALKTKQDKESGDSFKTITDKFGQPDMMSQAVSSEKEEIEAVWISGLKTDQGATLVLNFDNNQLVKIEQTGLKD